MKLENSFSVRAPIDEVWAALLDVERSAPCLPGAVVIERQGEDAYDLELDMTLGETSVSCQGQVAILEREHDDRRAVLRITADAEHGGAEARLVLSVVEQGDLTEGRLAADVSLTGAAAAVAPVEVRGFFERLIDSFARNLATMLGGGLPTVNGADPGSSRATVGHAPPASPVGVAAPAAVQVEIGEAAAGPSPQPGEIPREPRPAPAGPSSGDGSWAGATRQAGATIERLRSPLGAVLLGLVVLAALLRRARAAKRAAALAPPAPGSAA